MELEEKSISFLYSLYSQYPDAGGPVDWVIDGKKYQHKTQWKKQGPEIEGAAVDDEHPDLGAAPMIKTLLLKALRPANSIPAIFLLLVLLLFSSYINRRFSLPTGSAFYVEKKGIYILNGRTKKALQVKILGLEYNHYHVLFPNGRQVFVLRYTLKIKNPVLAHFFPIVFSKSKMQKVNAIPFKKEQHRTWYQERWKGYKRNNGEIYWRLIFPFALLLALAFAIAVPFNAVKSITAMTFFTVLLLYSLFAAGEKYKDNYSNVSYFRQLSLRIPYTYRGTIYVPDRTWYHRVRAFLGLKNRVLMLRHATLHSVKGTYVVADFTRGYTPGWARGGLPGWTLLYRNGPARLFHIK